MRFENCCRCRVAFSRSGNVSRTRAMEVAIRTGMEYVLCGSILLTDIVPSIAQDFANFFSLAVYLLCTLRDSNCHRLVDEEACRPWKLLCNESLVCPVFDSGPLVFDIIWLSKVQRIGGNLPESQQTACIALWGLKAPCKQVSHVCYARLPLIHAILKGAVKGTIWVIWI